LGRQLTAITGQLAVLAGKLSFRLHNFGLAEDYYSLADRMAMEIGDTALASLSWASRSTIFSNIDYGSGDRPRSRTALALLDAAAMSISRTASPYLGAWIRWHRAEELAALEEPYAAARNLDEGLRMVASASTRDQGLFASITVDSLAGYRGCCAVSLGNWIEAISVLEEAASGGPHLPWQDSAVRIDLAAAYARQSQVDHACALLAEALEAAHRSRMRGIVRRIRSVYLHTVVSQADLPEARFLDEQLSLVELGC
jgi:tetratricopeptide (TPR) repeat protein